MLESLARLRELEARIQRQDLSDSTLRLGLELARRLPEAEKVRFLAGSLLLVRGRPQEAVEHLEWAVRKSPRNPSAQANLGAAYQALGRREEAAAAYRSALEADPANAPARQRLQSLGLGP